KAPWYAAVAPASSRQSLRIRQKPARCRRYDVPPEGDIMRRLYYGWILARDLVGFCIANRIVWPLFFIGALAFLVILIGVAEISAPYVYTLF
ncbi:MAG TPA: hypothetical protein VMO17_18880, partial [Terriglobia bacterium]|nr:hypothetical protein [Terriglobia bacterium]